MSYDMDEFPDERCFTADLDAFADETGYEGTFSNREYLFPNIRNNDNQVYDYFNPYDEDECILKGERNPNKSIDNSSDTDPFGNNTYEHSEGDNKDGNYNPEELRKQRARQNSFRPFDDDDINNEDSEFTGYEFDPPSKDSNSQNPNIKDDDSGEFTGYNLEKAEDNSKEKPHKVQSHEKNSFENSLDQKFETNGKPVFQKINKSDLPATIKMNSFLSRELESIVLDENYFMLSIPEPNNPYGIKLKMYLFGTSEYKELHISSKEKVNDVIKHMITILKLDITEPKAYEIRLIDDDESYYSPFYEIAALEPFDSIGEFDALALCKNKAYKPPQMATIEDLNALGGSSSNSKKQTKYTFTVHIKLPFMASTVDIDMEQYESSTP